MMTKVIITVSILIIAMSCNNVKNTSKCQVYNTSIKDEDHSYRYMLSTEDKLYLVGSYRENYKNARTRGIFVKESKRGLEGKWTDIVTKIAGECEAVTQTSDYIYIISLEYLTEQYNPEFSKHKLYRISKESSQIEELYEWDKGNSFIRDVYFDSDEIGYIFFRPSGNPLDYQFLKTKNGGKEWSVIELNRPINVTHRTGEKLYFLSYKNNLRSDWIYSIDKYNDNLDSIQFDLNITDFSVEENGDYWLLGKEGNKTVLQRYANGQTTDVHTFSNDSDISPDQLYKYNELIVVIASQIDENMLLGFGGTKPLMFVSKDNGVTWNNHRLDEALYLKPISFYKDEQMTAYVGNGKFLTCKFQ
jgi:hypothetical protein